MITTDDQITDADLDVMMPENDDLLPHILESGIMRHINVTLKEVVIPDDARQANPGYTYERGFIITDPDFNRLARNTTYEHAFNMTRRAAKLLLDNVPVESVRYRFPNQVRVTYHVEELPGDDE